jgi:hypothetical protein
MNSTHSINSANSNHLRLILFLLFTFTFVPPLAAQYYEQSAGSSSNRFILAGFFQREFEPRWTNSQPDSLRIAFKRIMPTIGFREAMVDITFGYTRYSLRGQDKTSILASVTVGNEFPLAFSPSHALLLPIMIASDYTRSDNTATDKEDFNIGSVGIGAGVKYRFRQPRFELSIQAAEAVHWSFEGFSTGSGFSAVTTGEVLFVLRNALVLDGIALGYRFRYQTWNMNNDAFDYKSLSHGAFVGVLF